MKNHPFAFALIIAALTPIPVVAQQLDPAIRTAHPGGTEQELMTVYTIVNAVLTNLPKLQEVQILIGGQEADTLAGHVDLRRPLRKNETLIAKTTP